MLEEYFAKQKPGMQTERLQDLCEQIHEHFPQLVPVVKWNQPMFTDHGTYIIGFSQAKKHFSVAPEQTAMKAFHDEIQKDGYAQTANLFRIEDSQPVNTDLIFSLIRFNLEHKKDTKTFWESA